MKKLVVSVITALVCTLAACGGDEVQCVAKGETFTFCDSEENIYRCPAGTAEQVTYNNSLTQKCEEEAGNDTAALAQCTFDAEYKYIDAELVEACEKTCREVTLTSSGVSTEATCEDDSTIQ